MAHVYSQFCVCVEMGAASARQRNSIVARCGCTKNSLPIPRAIFPRLLRIERTPRQAKIRDSVSACQRTKNHRVFAGLLRGIRNIL